MMGRGECKVWTSWRQKQNFWENWEVFSWVQKRTCFWMGNDLRWWWIAVFKTWREEWDWKACRSWFHGREKWGTNEWRWALVLSFGRFTLRGFWWTTCVLQIPGWGATNHREGRGHKAGKEEEKGRETTDLLVMSKWETQRHSFLMRDNNDLEGFHFHGIKRSKVWGREASPQGRSLFHQAVDESLVGG